MPPTTDSQGRTFIHHPNGQTTHYILSDYTDPWKPATSTQTILLQPGFARHSAFWYHWIPRLSCAGYRIIRRDLRGHGLSSVPSSSTEPPYAYTLDTILSEIIDTLDQLGLQKVHFVGESTSGILALALAARFPSRFHSITLISTPLYLPPAAQTLFAFNEPSWPAALRILGARGWAERLAAVPGTMAHPDPGYEAWWLEQIGVQSGEGLAGYAEFLCREEVDARGWVERGEVAGGGVPVLVLVPERSAAVRVEEAGWVKERVPRARVVVVGGRGHEIYTEMAEECQTEFLKFLGDLEGGKVKVVEEEG
ncbi:Bifunctional epoxide hydrolase 2 [Lasiodiplodia theobromae]|uniref:Bifunctional epoxide hydrolase 2 n=1 Tax=Lasiodiplodia theobromae TaxID=45133 RepID=A0A5N5CVW1_9PEZI|nr:Bifunctional epoxide hydrolase 2 [Lasiodiplodia theobromae]